MRNKPETMTPESDIDHGTNLLVKRQRGDAFIHATFSADEAKQAFGEMGVIANGIDLDSISSKLGGRDASRAEVPMIPRRCLPPSVKKTWIRK